MKLEALRNLNWGINRRAVKFSKGQIFDVPENIAKDMLNAGAAKEVLVNKKVVIQSNKAIESSPEKKVIESAPENKKSEKPKKKIVKKKVVKKKES